MKPTLNVSCTHVRLVGYPRFRRQPGVSVRFTDYNYPILKTVPLNLKSYWQPLSIAWTELVADFVRRSRQRPAIPHPIHTSHGTTRQTTFASFLHSSAWVTLNTWTVYCPGSKDSAYPPYASRCPFPPRAPVQVPVPVQQSIHRLNVHYLSLSLYLSTHRQ
jgi:hypothetical protein